MDGQFYRQHRGRQDEWNRRWHVGKMTTEMYKVKSLLSSRHCASAHSGTDIKSNVGPPREFSDKTRRNTQSTNSQVTCQIPCLWSFIHSQTYHIRLSIRKNNSLPHKVVRKEEQLRFIVQNARLNRLPESAPVGASGIRTSGQPEDFLRPLQDQG
jgi:hypothetical protein